MKKTVLPLFIGVATLVLLIGLGPEAVAEENTSQINVNKTAFNTDVEKASYVIGYNQVDQLIRQTQGVVDLAAFRAGLLDALDKKDSQLADADPNQFFPAFQAAIEAKQSEAFAGEVAKGEAFRAGFAAQEGVVTLPSGLLYQVIVAGDGPNPGPTDTVVTHYHGTLIDGTVFDSSVERDSPASFPVNGVIRGWTEALQLMGVGSKWKLVIPPDLAYGQRGAGSAIPPEATLVFEVELLGINPAQQ